MKNNQTALSDTPVSALDEDALSNARYAEALGSFIDGADTPLTIGIQGGWGTGKTSLLNLLAVRFKTSEGSLVVKLNAWEHSLFTGADNSAVALSLLQGLISCMQGAVESRQDIPADLRRAVCGKDAPLVAAVRSVGKVALGLGYLGAKAALATLAHVHVPDGEAHDGPQASPAEQVQELRNQITAAVNLLVETDGSPVKRLVFFIDDLDRVNPETAVKVLDVLKNVFDVRHCVFLLAIDYEVVVKGLTSRFGARTAANEREFRQYFDKIIQVPFSMPVSSYRRSFDGYMQRLLRNLSLDDEAFKVSELSSVAWMATSGVPRSVKRIVNTMSLLSMMGRRTEEGSSRLNAGELSVLFKLVCLQISFPEVYLRITQKSDVKSWSLDTMKADFGVEFDDAAIEAAQQRYSEPYQQVLALLLRSDPWSAPRTHDAIEIVSSLLGDLEASQEDSSATQGVLNELLASTLVTSVGADSSSSVTETVRNDSITVFCRQMHLALIEEGVAAPADPSEIYAKRQGGRHYGFAVKNSRLDMGWISVVKVAGVQQLELSVAVRIPASGRNGFKAFMRDEMKQGQTISRIEYPYFYRTLGPYDTGLPPSEVVEAFRQLVTRVANHASSWESR